MENNIAAVVVTYNREQLLLECIEEIENQQDSVCDIIVVDNGTEKEIQEIIKSLKYENIIYIKTIENLGGSGGFNFGIKKAIELGYEYVWLMDDDCIPQKTSLKELKKASDKYKEYGFLSSKVLWKDGNIAVMNIQKQKMYKRLNVKKETDDTEITMASFVSCFIPVKIIKEVGLPIKEFFIWTDDWEYTRRITRKHKAFYIPSSKVIHKLQNNFGANIAEENIKKLDRFFYLYRNDVYLYRREGLKGWLYLSIRLIYHILRILFFAKDNKIKRIKQMFKGLIAGLSFCPKIEMA